MWAAPPAGCDLRRLTRCLLSLPGLVGPVGGAVCTRAAGRRDLIGACARGTHHCPVRLTPAAGVLTLSGISGRGTAMSRMTVMTGPVTGGVDTHSLTHHAAVIDQVGPAVGRPGVPHDPGGLSGSAGLAAGVW